jgi:hypothetical protein
MEPQTIEATEVLPVKDDVLRGIDVKSPTMMSLGSALFKSEDLLAINAALAPTVSRELDNTGAKSDVAMPASQEYETENVGYITPNDLSNMDAIFRDEYVNDEKYVCMSPKTAAAMKNNSRDYFQNVDFIGRMGALADGIVEKAESFSVLVVPQIPDGVFFAFCQRAITANTWDARTSRIDQLPTQRFATQLYTRQDVNAVRNDDLGVVHGTIKV